VNAPRRLLCLGALLLHAACALAAVEVNQAGVADLDGVKGIGPALSGRILAERARGPFSDWRDLIARVKGIGPAAAGRLSAEGLTVNGAAYPQAARQPPSTAPGH
jgi:competence protein ComEA